MTHGGKRAGAGRPRASINEQRVLVLEQEGLSRPEIAKRFGVTLQIIRGVILRSKAQQTLTKGN